MLPWAAALLFQGGQKGCSCNAGLFVRDVCAGEFLVNYPHYSDKHTIKNTHNNSRGEKGTLVVKTLVVKTLVVKTHTITAEARKAALATPAFLSVTSVSVHRRRITEHASRHIRRHMRPEKWGYLCTLHVYMQFVCLYAPYMFICTLYVYKETSSHVYKETNLVNIEQSTHTHTHTHIHPHPRTHKD